MKNVRSEKQSEHNLSASSNNFRIVTEDKSQLQTGSLISRNSRADAAYTFQVWPKGKFTFSAASGFSGEADSMRITGTRQKSGQLHMQSETTSNKSKKATASQHQEKKEVSDKLSVKKVATPSWKFIIAGGMVLFLFGFWLYRKLKFRQINPHDYGKDS